MKNDEIYFAIGQLTAKVDAQAKELHSVKTSVEKLVEADTLARGGKKMLIKVGALSSTIGAGLGTIATLVIKYVTA